MLGVNECKPCIKRATNKCNLYEVNGECINREIPDRWKLFYLEEIEALKDKNERMKNCYNCKNQKSNTCLICKRQDEKYINDFWEEKV